MKLLLPLLLIFTGCFGITSNIAALPDGQELFERMKCFRCHDPEYNKLGPPLKVIAGFYATDEKLLNYFNGKSDPVVKPEMSEVMKESLAEIFKLDGQEKASLASYIMRYK